MRPQITKADRCRSLRYKRPALAELGYSVIVARLEIIQEECSEIHWAFDDDETLINAFDGNDDEAYEFKMMFADVESTAMRLSDALYDNFSYDDDPEREFDDMSVALIGNRYNLVGYDGYEEDYSALTGYDAEIAATEAGKRVMRKTKAEMLASVGQVMGIILAFQDVQLKFDYLHATVDIFRDENISILQVIKDIEAKYNALFDGTRDEKQKANSEFERLTAELPPKYWAE
jgi:hypothetical protein